MLTKPTGWDRIFALPHRVEYYVIIGERMYTDEQIVSLQVERALFERPGIGNTAAAQLTVSLLGVDTADVPRMARLDIRCRLVSIDNPLDATETVAKGTYWVDTRETDQDTGVLTLNCFDAMLKAEQRLVDPDDEDADEWPKTESAVAALIAQRMGVTVDPRTVLRGYSVPYPTDWTCREILGSMAVANAGNWMITDYNQLMLVPYAVPMAVLGSEDDAAGALTANGDMILLPSLNPDGSRRMNLTADVAELLDGGRAAPIENVRIYYDDDLLQVAPIPEVEGGYTLEVFCYYATGQMAEDVLEDVSGFAYHAFRAETALIDPCAELGDVVLLEGIANRIGTMSITMDDLYTADISAPGGEEVDHEYHYEAPIERDVSRRVRVGTSYEGVSITRKNGITVTHYERGEPTQAGVTLNSHGMVATDQAGNTKLDFDFAAGQFDFNGYLNATGRLESPEIYGDEIYADAAFIARQEDPDDPGTMINMGYMGPGYGYAEGTDTPGVILSHDSPDQGATIYVIVTSAGVRMQAPNASVYVYAGHAVLSAGGNVIDVSASGATLNGSQIATLDDIPDEPTPTP